MPPTIARLGGDVKSVFALLWLEFKGTVYYNDTRFE